MGQDKGVPGMYTVSHVDMIANRHSLSIEPLHMASRKAFSSPTVRAKASNQNKSIRFSASAKK
jgi:hypothetical protein